MSLTSSGWGLWMYSLPPRMALGSLGTAVQPCTATGSLEVEVEEDMFK